jgi:N-acyl-D-aspartate/D-glutamate deacylase
MKADVIVFDPDTTRDLSTFEDPHHFSEGITDVVVNGVPVLLGGNMTKALPGKTIRGRGYTRGNHN